MGKDQDLIQAVKDQDLVTVQKILIKSRMKQSSKFTGLFYFDVIDSLQFPAILFHFPRLVVQVGYNSF